MASSDLGRSVAQGFLFLANMLNTVTIDKVVVPELVQMGNSSAVLDCQFTAADDRFTLQWLFNREETVYEWSPGTPPKVNGILEGSLDPNFKVSDENIQEGRAFRIVKLDPGLSGEYTCRVFSDGGEARQTKTMLVFSPEKDFVLEVHPGKHHDEHHVKCSARGLYPQPELTLEYNQEPLPRQSQRVWRSGPLYEATSAARLRARIGRVACRLQLPPAGYTALRTRTLHHTRYPTNEKTHEKTESREGKQHNGANPITNLFNFYSFIILIVFMRLCLVIC